MRIESTIVGKWATCKSNLVVGFGGEDGYALKEEGYNESYCCEHPEIIARSTARKEFVENGQRKEVALLHEIGKIVDPEVLKDLEKWCSSCPYYQRKTR